jgi:hypothetical protein
MHIVFAYVSHSSNIGFRSSLGMIFGSSQGIFRTHGRDYRFELGATSYFPSKVLSVHVRSHYFLRLSVFVVVSFEKLALRRIFVLLLNLLQSLLQTQGSFGSLSQCIHSFKFNVDLFQFFSKRQERLCYLYVKLGRDLGMGL